MEGSAAYKLVLAGKSSAENEIAISLKSNNSIKLLDSSEVSINLLSEVDKLVKDDDSFDFELFMKSLSTNQFGRLLIWSARLSSTHDVVSQ